MTVYLYNSKDDKKKGYGLVCYFNLIKYECNIKKKSVKYDNIDPFLT